MRVKLFSVTLVLGLGVVLLCCPLCLAGHPIGDVNNDVIINVGDVVYLVSYLYKGGPEPTPVVDAGDVNHDCIVNVGDVVYLVSYLYKGGPPPCGGTGMIYGYVTYTHLEGAVDGAAITIQSTGQNATSQDECEGYYILKGVDPGTYTLTCVDPDDANSPILTENGVSVVAGEMTQQDLALYPTITYTIEGPRATGGIGSQNWTRGCHKYVLLGECSVIGDQELAIDPGVTVYGSVGQPTSFLAIQKNGIILADGEPCLPIVFTSNAGTGNRRGGDWGGLMLFGYSPLNVGQGVAEGDAGEFGCTPGVDCDEHDSSGVLRYVRVEFAGVELGPGNELNGIAMYGVGDKTVIDYVQVHRNYDDGIEWFGGTNNAKHVLVSECYDDHFDWTDGARFKAQFVALRGYGGDPGPPDDHWGDRMMEADNQESNFDLLPRSNPIVLNVTIVGGKEVRGGMISNDRNIYFRHGTAGRVLNLISMDATTYGFDLKNQSYFAWDNNPAVWPNGNILRDTLNVDYAIWFNNADGHWRWRDLVPNVFPFNAHHLCNPDTNANAHSYVDVDPTLWTPRLEADPDLRPQSGSPALDPTKALPLGHPVYDDPFFEYVPYLGAFDVGLDPTGQDNDWTYPWAAWPDN